jgi:hypothetical protein
VRIVVTVSGMKKRMRVIITVLLVVLDIFLVTVIGSRLYDAHITAQHNTCIANLKQIESATVSWAMETKRGAHETPTKQDLIGTTLYIKKEPKCPCGGVYTLSAPADKPTCSYPGHVLQ